MKKSLCFILALSMIVCILASCGVIIPSGSNENGRSEHGVIDKGSDKPDGSSYKDGVIGGNGGNGDIDAPTEGGDYYEIPEAEPADDGGYYPPIYEPGMPDKSTGDVVIRDGDGDVIDGIVYPGGKDSPAAGTLTAGEWRDIENLEEWAGRFNENNWYAYAQGRELFANSVIKVNVKDGDSSIFNAPVELLKGDKVLYAARTDINGCAYLFYNVNTNTENPDSVRVGSNVYALNGEKELTVDAAGLGNDVKALDLMLMIDTTGSMGDELEYLKVELADMVKRISDSGTKLSIRVSVNFYRDEGDEYVVKYFDFRSDINECVKQIKGQRAMGGGDWPEAVHTALDNAVTGHQWRNEAVKICFFVLDAPPHTESERQGVNASILTSLTKAAEQGIRIIPVASSGVDTETELILRSFAVMTGGSYIFLTNHSGVGDGHIDPTVDGEYKVEPLNECMIRVVCEYCGLTYSSQVTPQTQIPPFNGQK